MHDTHLFGNPFKIITLKSPNPKDLLFLLLFLKLILIPLFRNMYYMIKPILGFSLYKYSNIFLYFY